MYVRKFRVSDSVEVAKLHRNTIRFVNKKDYLSRQIEVWSGRTSAKRFRDSIKTRFRYVAVDKNKIVGFGDFSKDGELAGLYVHNDYQRKGIGYLLLKKLEKAARQKGIRRFFCYSTITAKDFYKKHGYRIIQKTKHSIKNQKLTVYKMERQI